MDLVPDATLPETTDRPALFGEGATADPVAALLAEAAAKGASHVHLDPDGETMRVRLRIGGRLLDTRRLLCGDALHFEGQGVSVATLGGRIVLHLAPRDLHCPALEALGMTPALARTLGGATAGLVLVAGPARSGRSTTLAALLDTRDDGARNLLTANNAAGLRAALRQDPDAIRIESLGDREMVALALQAAEAGHLVLAGVDAADAV
ncbi:MAG: ATPase, T2SS/T4P/T4SS family, partial [Sphingomonas sp.]